MWGLPGYTEIQSKPREGFDNHLDARFLLNETERPGCDCGAANVKKHGFDEIDVRDTSLGQTWVGLRIRYQRYQCKGCRKIFPEKLPFVHPDHRMTERLVEHIEKSTHLQPFKVVAESLGISVSTVREIFTAYKNREMAKNPIATPKYMGIDGVRIGGVERGMIVNVAQNTLVAFLPRHTEQAMNEWFTGLRDSEDIHCVVMDFSDAFRRTVKKHLPEAKIVVDRFHALQLSNIGMEAVRKIVRTEAKSNRALMKGDRHLLLSNTSDLDSQERRALEAMLERFPRLKAAHEAKEAFHECWRTDDAAKPEERLAVAEKRFEAWGEAHLEEIDEGFAKLVGAFLYWKEEMLNYFGLDRLVTNGITESLNASAQLFNRLGRGYSFEMLEAKLLLNHTFHKRSTAPRYQRNPQPYNTLAGEGPFSQTGDYGFDLARAAEMPELG